MTRAGSALMTASRLAEWIGWRDCSAPFCRADAEMVAADFNRRHALFEHRVSQCGTMFVVQRRPRQ